MAFLQLIDRAIGAACRGVLYITLAVVFVILSANVALRYVAGTSLASAKLYEVQKYLTLSGHKYETNPFVMSKRSWDRLTPADQKIFIEAGAEATQAQRKLSKEADEKLVAELKAKGVQIDTVDRKTFVDATKPVYTKWSTGPIGEFVQRVSQQAH